jgi:ABC-type spermidine/putrescine transport system permease subunit II
VKTGANRLPCWAPAAGNSGALSALPVLTPALLGTFVILLANALGAYATVYALTTGNFNVLPIRIAALVSGDISLDPNMASALAVILVGLMTLVTLVHQWLLKRSLPCRALNPPSASVYHRSVVWLLFLILLLPLLGTLIYSIASSWSATVLPSGFTFKWYVQLWSDPRFLARRSGSRYWSAWRHWRCQWC